MSDIEGSSEYNLLRSTEYLTCVNCMQLIADEWLLYYDCPDMYILNRLSPNDERCIVHR
jgi:hypothetical protein